MPRIASLNDFRKEDNGDDEGQDFYTGGEKSYAAKYVVFESHIRRGMAVRDRKIGKDDDDENVPGIIRSILNAARKY